MMKICFLIMLFLTISGFSQEKKWDGKSVDFSHGRLVVSENKRFLVFEDGTPFFYLGDTAWELFHRLSKDDAEKYLENRREKGFTVIQAVILAELDGLNVPNMEGERPLIDNDPEKPNEQYFQHVDRVIRMAAEKGMFIGLLPTWGDKVTLNSWGKGPEIFTPENAFAYGKYLGNRYKDYSNIIWINGGDRQVDDRSHPIWNALAIGIKSADQNHLMTFHPPGENTSSQWFHHESWLDFNMCQTGHSQRSYSIYQLLVKKDYGLKPVKPCLDGEPRYEDHPVKWKPEQYGWFYDTDVRQAAYWSLFTGAFGHTYGCHAIWQMLTPDRQPIGSGRNTWEKDLDLPGAWHMLHARRLMESRPFTDRKPFQQIIKNEFVPETDYLVATRGKDYLFVYIPSGLTTKLDLKLCKWKHANCWWYNPRTGESTATGTIEAKGIKEFETPTKGLGNDWILVLDNAEAGFGAPGK